MSSSCTLCYYWFVVFDLEASATIRRYCNFHEPEREQIVKGSSTKRQKIAALAEKSKKQKGGYHEYGSKQKSFLVYFNRVFEEMKEPCLELRLRDILCDFSCGKTRRYFLII
jgi:hypothetical protein